jgi:hypothetical protein
MTIREMPQRDHEAVPSEELQTLLKQQKRERLKAAARELATSTPEEQAAFLEHLERRPWSTRE